MPGELSVFQHYRCVHPPPEQLPVRGAVCRPGFEAKDLLERLCRTGCVVRLWAVEDIAKDVRCVLGEVVHVFSMRGLS